MDKQTLQHEKNEATIVKSVENWLLERKASMLEFDCNNKKDAWAIQEVLSRNGYVAYVSHFGSSISVVLYLSDYKK